MQKVIPQTQPITTTKGTPKSHNVPPPPHPPKEAARRHATTPRQRGAGSATCDAQDPTADAHHDGPRPLAGVAATKQDTRVAVPSNPSGTCSPSQNPCTQHMGAQHHLHFNAPHTNNRSKSRIQQAKLTLDTNLSSGPKERLGALSTPVRMPAGNDGPSAPAPSFGLNASCAVDDPWPPPSPTPYTYTHSLTHHPHTYNHPHSSTRQPDSLPTHYFITPNAPHPHTYTRTHTIHTPTPNTHPHPTHTPRTGCTAAGTARLRPQSPVVFRTSAHPQAPSVHTRLEPSSDPRTAHRVEARELTRSPP